MPAARKYNKNTKKNKNKNRKNNNKKRNNVSSASSSTPASGLSTPVSGQSSSDIEESEPTTQLTLATTESDIDEPTPELVFMDLTCGRELEFDFYEDRLSHSTHDLAELMLYSYVDASPYVADFIYSKQLLKQGEFLTLTDEKDWSDVPTIEFSTHEPYY